MKTLLMSLVTFLSISSMLFAQEASTANTAVSQSQNELNASKINGNYSFILPGALTSEDVANNAKYYVHYFSVDFLPKTNEAKIKMNINDEKSRHVIMRFLTACGVRYMKVDGTDINLEEFFVKYIQ